MRYVLLSLAAVLFLGLATNLPGADHTPFLGSWQLDTANQPMLEGRPVTSATLTIQYHHKTMVLSQSANYAGGEKTVTMDWKLDHNYHPMTGAGTGEYKAKWEGAAILAAEHEMEGGHESIRLALSPDGRTMTETTHHVGASGIIDQTFVWRRP